MGIVITAPHQAGALLDKRAVAAQLGVSVRTVNRLQAAGELRPVRLGLRTVRNGPADVAALIERRRG
jgi:excisionase family DNA binding protein